MDLKEQREEVIRDYIESGRKERDDQFRRSLALGPTSRRWLGWGGRMVKVLRAVEGPEVPLCPTNWIYHFVGWDGQEPVIESSEINFCDDGDVIDKLPPWYKTKEIIDFLKNDIKSYVPMYYI